VTNALKPTDFICINLNAIKDKVFVANNRKEMDHLLSEGTRTADETLDLVMAKLK
jgi:formiminotetrahydrofolate cyclodeaminase